jgi:hypothetical protein
MSAGESATCHPELQFLRIQLRNMLSSISTFGPVLPKPPVIDSSFDLGGQSTDSVQRREAVRGMRALKDSVKRDLDVLEKVSLVFPFPTASSCESTAAVVSRRSSVCSSPGPIHERPIPHRRVEGGALCAFACDRGLEHVLGDREVAPPAQAGAAQGGWSQGRCRGRQREKMGSSQYVSCHTIHCVPGAGIQSYTRRAAAKSCWPKQRFT